MAGELQLERQPDWADDREAAGTVLDRHLSLSVSAGRWIAVALALIAALALRMPGLNRWALSAAEGETATAARDLLLGNDVPSHVLGRPFTIEWTTLFLFLGHSTDSVARMSAVAAGVGLVVMVVLLARWFGPAPAISSAMLIALSPTMIASSRRLDGGMLVALLMLALVALALASRDRNSQAWPVLLGVVSALLILSGPLGVVALLIGAVGAYLISRPATMPATSSILPGLGGFMISYVLLVTVFFTRPSGLFSATAEIFRQLFSVHFANIGDRFHVPVFNLIVNEPLLIVLALAGLVASNQRVMARALGIWSLLTLVTVSLIGDTGIAGHALVVLPIALLAGLGAAHLLVRLPWSLVRRGPGALYVAALLLLFLAILSVIGLLSPAGGLAGWDWFVRLILVVVIVVLPLAVFVSMIAPRITGHHLVLLLTTVLLIFSSLTVRSAVLSASERPGEPMDPLAQGAIASSVPAIVDRVQRISVDLTRTQRSVQDPTGGHGLAIAIDEQIEQPLRWYFREFPNVTVYDPDIEQADNNPQVIFLAGDRDPESAAPGMHGATYLYAYEAPAVYSDPDWRNLLGGLFRISDWRQFWGFLIERTAPAQAHRQDFQLMLAPDIAERVFGPTGPFALADRAGGGLEGGQFNSPRGIAFTDDGTTYVVDSGNQRIQVFDPSGNFIDAFGEPGDGPGQLGLFGSGQGGAGGIAVAEDRVFVADTWNHRIQAFGLDGEFLYEWGSFFDALDDPDLTASNPGEFYGPRGIAVQDGLVFVTDTGNERVQVFDLDGEFVRMWGSTGTEEGQLLEPVGLAANSEAVYVADSHNARIARYTHDGELLDIWPITAWDGLRFYEPYLALAGDGRLLATTSVTNEILIFEADGAGGEPISAPDVLRPFGIAVHPDGETAFVTDGLRNAVLPLDIANR